MSLPAPVWSQIKSNLILVTADEDQWILSDEYQIPFHKISRSCWQTCMIYFIQGHKLRMKHSLTVYYVRDWAIQVGWHDGWPCALLIFLFLCLNLSLFLFMWISHGDICCYYSDSDCSSLFLCLTNVFIIIFPVFCVVRFIFFEGYNFSSPHSLQCNKYINQIIFIYLILGKKSSRKHY